jgi:hypothetical protein
MSAEAEFLAATKVPPSLPHFPHFPHSPHFLNPPTLLSSPLLCFMSILPHTLCVCVSVCHHGTPLSFSSGLSPTHRHPQSLATSETQRVPYGSEAGSQVGSISGVIGGGHRNRQEGGTLLCTHGTCCKSLSCTHTCLVHTPLSSAWMVRKRGKRTPPPPRACEAISSPPDHHHHHRFTIDPPLPLHTQTHQRGWQRARHRLRLRTGKHFWRGE